MIKLDSVYSSTPRNSDHHSGGLSCTILSRLSLISFIRTWLSTLIGSNKEQKTPIFWDPYSKNMGIIISILVVFVGRERLGEFLEKLSGLLGVILKPVPHGDNVKDYHIIQLKAEAIAHEYVKDYYQCSEYIKDPFYVCMLMDEDSVDSMTLKDIGYCLQSLVENVQVLKSLGYEDMTLAIEKNSFPDALLMLIQQREIVKLHYWRGLDVIFSVPVVVVIVLSYLFMLLPRLVKIASVSGRTNNTLLAVEYVDPSCAEGRSTEPNYLSQYGYPENSIIAYVRNEQVRRIGGREKFKLPNGGKVVFLDSIGITVDDLFVASSLYFYLVLAVLRGKRSLIMSRKWLSEINLIIGFNAFLRTYLPSGHYYNIIPNGKAATRYDSGIITGKCRQYSVYSMTYQSRVYYRKNIYYFFDAFDEYFMWGSAWIEVYSEPQFVKKFTVIGNTGLDSYPQTLAKTHRINDLTQPALIVFTADIDRYHPLHYTYDYTHSFMMVLLEAVGQFNDMNSGHSVFSIYIKPKDPEHIPILLESPEVQFLIKKYRINLNMIANKRHDIETVIDAADKVISIGFTTPGLDALGKKKASVYFTPYKGIYNPIFDSVDTPLVVHNVDELKSFLSGEIHPSNELLDSVLYRSGESTGVRLVAATIQAIATRGY